MSLKVKDTIFYADTSKIGGWRRTFVIFTAFDTKETKSQFLSLIHMNLVMFCPCHKINSLNTLLICILSILQLN